MRMSLQGNLNQMYPSDPSCCPLWPSIIIVNQGKNWKNQVAHFFVAYLIFTDVLSPFDNKGLFVSYCILSCKTQMTIKLAQFTLSRRGEKPVGPVDMRKTRVCMNTRAEVFAADTRQLFGYRPTR